MLDSGDQRVVEALIQQHKPDAQISDVQLLRERSNVADGAAIYLVAENYMLLVAPEEFPDAMEQQAAAMTAMNTALSPNYHEVILPLIGTGKLGDRSFMIVPRRTPLRSGKLGRRIDHFRVSRPALQWLRGLTSLMAAPDQHSKAEFCTSLATLADLTYLPDHIRSIANHMISRVVNGDLVAQHVPMHGDLWSGNLLRDDKGRLIVIDWGGSTLKGYGVFDLMRLASSIRVGQHALRRELAWHREVLGQGTDGLRLHLLGALGHFGSRLGEFPRDRFAAMVEECYGRLAVAIY